MIDLTAKNHRNYEWIYALHAKIKSTYCVMKFHAIETIKIIIFKVLRKTVCIYILKMRKERFKLA